MVKRNQFKTLLIVAVTLSVLLSSCTKEQTTGSVSGTISRYHPESPDQKTPIEGISVFLIDTDFVVDSSDYSHNEAAIIDQALTGADGQYLMDQIPLGNYAVVPVPDTIMYRFELTNDADSVKFAIREDAYDYSLDFTAAEPEDKDAVFQIQLSIINRLGGGSISISRPVFLFNIFPTYYPVRMHGELQSDADDLMLNLPYGIFGYLYVVSNNFMVKAYDSAGYYLFTRWISNDYFNTPEFAHWQIDWTAQTITRI